MHSSRMSVLTLLAMVLAAYSQQAPVQNIPSRMVVEGYFNGRMVSRYWIDNKDDGYARLVALLRRERSGWSQDFVTYAPGFVFRGNGIRIDCHRDRIIINFKGGQIGKRIADVYEKLGVAAR